jgi:molybdopterin synthase catalytic subunit
MEGKNHLITGPIPPAFVTEQLSRHADKLTIGAHSFFLGQVRADIVEGKTVAAIEYSAYEEMIQPVVKTIKEELFGEYADLVCLHIWHSTGIVKAGEASLLVMVSSGHRKEAFQALEACVELIKEKLPVWKKEHFSDGSSRWI